MARSNKEVVQGYLEDVINAKKFDCIDDYFAADYVFHTAPYVGLGINNDDTSGDKVVVFKVRPGGPADGRLVPGDQILRVSDGSNTWETFSQLRGPTWGQGVTGVPLTVRVLRGGKQMDIQVTRGLIPGFDMRFADFKDMFQHSMTKTWPDQKTKVVHILEEGDLVAVYLQSNGTNMDYNRYAVWDAFDLYRLRGGKIVEGWGVENEFVLLKQLGYSIEPPA